MNPNSSVPIYHPRVISGYHAHVYFDESSWPAANALYDLVPRLFAVSMGGVLDHPFGPHPKPMYQISFAPEQFEAFVPWLMLNRLCLSVLVHPLLNDEVLEHKFFAFWLGEPLPLRLEGLRTFQAGDEVRNPW